MKMALLVCNTYFEDRVMETLQQCGIDYYTRWEKAMGKGHHTEPHLGTGTYASLNGVFMIGFEDEALGSALGGLDLPPGPDRTQRETHACSDDEGHDSDRRFHPSTPSIGEGDGRPRGHRTCASTD